MNTIYLYCPKGTTSPYNVGRKICSLAMEYPEPFDFVFLEQNRKNICRGLDLRKRRALFHLPVQPWISLRPYWRCLNFFRSKGIPIVANIHGDYVNEPIDSFMDRDLVHGLLLAPSALASRFILKLPRYLIVNSLFMKKRIVETFGVDEELIFVIPNGIDVPNDLRIDELRDYSNVHSSNKIVIFSHGTLTRGKGYFELIRAIASIKRDDFILYISGYGPMKDKLEKLIHDLNIADKVILLGYTPFNDIMGYLSKADICIYPSKFDTFNIASLESMLYSKGTVLISSQCGIKEFLPYNLENNIFEPECEIIADRLMKAMNDFHGVENLVKSQKDFANSLNWKNIWIFYKNIYQSIFDKMG